MITTGNQLLYSLGAARRITGRAVQQVRVFRNAIWLHIEGERPTFLSKRHFKAHFVEWRIQRSHLLKVTQRLDQPHCFTVHNANRDTAYYVEARPDGMYCTCDDFHNQLEFFGRGCCKHGYAVLNSLGCQSLEQYLAAVSERLAA
jgi:hypothetical protein